MSFVAVAVAGVGAAAAIGGAALSSSAQSKSAKEATNAQTQAADEATALQREMYYQQRQDIAPWRQAGRWALTRLQDNLRRGPGEPFRGPAGLNPTQYAFTPPTPESLVNDPGYQFRLRSGQQALEGTAAARGGLLSGGTLRGLTQFGQELGSQEYGQAYTRALGQNELTYGRALTQNTDAYQRALTAYNSRQGLRQQQYNRLAGLAGVGQQTTQYLGELGSQYAQQAGNLALQRGNALAANQVAQGQIWGNFAQTIGGGLGSLGMAYLQRPPSPEQAGYGRTTEPYDPWEFAR